MAVPDPGIQDRKKSVSSNFCLFISKPKLSLSQEGNFQEISFSVLLARGVSLDPEEAEKR